MSHSVRSLGHTPRMKTDSGGPSVIPCIADDRTYQPHKCPGDCEYLIFSACRDRLGGVVKAERKTGGPAIAKAHGVELSKELRA